MSSGGAVTVARRPRRRRPAAPSSSRANSDSCGRRSWYCRSRAASSVVVQSQVVTLAVGVDQLQLGDPVELAREGGRVGLEAVRARLPAVEHAAADLSSAEASSPRSAAYLRARSIQLPLDVEGGHGLAGGELDGRRRVGSCETARMAATGWASVRSRSGGSRPRSSPARARSLRPSGRSRPRRGWRRPRSRAGAGTSAGRRAARHGC